ncbi:MAG: DsrE family protein [Gammaproteobacteria bacterium]
MRSITLLFIVIILMADVYAKSKMGPTLTNYGPILPVANMDIPLPEDFKYKAVFDVATTASEIDAHSRRLESVARFINMHTDRGVALDDMHLAVVIHGKAAKDILTDEAYAAKFDTENPNRELIQSLAKLGVRFYICGQTSDFSDYQRKDILPEVAIALSAMTQLVILQSEGYALLP